MKTQSYSCYALLLLCIGICLVSCKGNGSKKSQENEISFDSVSVEKTSHLLDQEQNPNCNLKIKFIYPDKMGTNTELLKTIQKQFVSKYFGEDYEALPPKEAVAKYTDDYLKNYKSLEEEYKKELQDGEEVKSWFSYYEISENAIVYNQRNLLSYTVYTEGYTGGAHGSHSHVNQTIDLKTGKPVNEEDIFIDDYQDDLAKIIVEEIAKKNKVTEAKELENLGYFSIDEIYPNKNFYVNGEGLVYTFNEYEIAAYVVGAITIELPFERINNLLRKDSPISALAF